MTNLSKHIDPEICKHCGECCRIFKIWYPTNPDPVILSEMDRFERLAWMGDLVYRIEEKTGYWLVFDIPCKHLIAAEDDTVFCEIYNSPDRPLLCRSYPFDGDNYCPPGVRE